MRGIFCMILFVYWTVTVVLTIVADNGTKSRFLQWFMGVDERGRDKEGLFIAPVDISVMALFFLLWLVDRML